MGKKKGYDLNEKNEPDFLTSIPWKSTGNYSQKNLFKENGKKNRHSPNFQRIFTKLSEKVSLDVNRRCVKSRKNPSKISADAIGFAEISNF